MIARRVIEFKLLQEDKKLIDTSVAVRDLMGPRLDFERPARADVLSVVIPCAYDPSGLDATLTSLDACNKPDVSIEIVVANDGNDPEVSRVIAGHGVREVVLDPNQGSGAARNRALEQTAGSIIACVDADPRVDPNWLIEAWRASGRAEYAGGRVLIDREKVFSLGHQYDALNAFDTERALARAGFAQTCNLVVHRRLFERAGGFIERLRSGEDVEFGDRVRRFGATQIYWPDALVHHPPRNLRQQWSKLRRVLAGQTLMAEIWPDRFPQFRVTLLRILRLLLPPRGIARRDADIHEFNAMRTPLFYLIKWGFKLATVYHLLAIIAQRPDQRGWGDADFRDRTSKR